MEIGSCIRPRYMVIKFPAIQEKIEIIYSLHYKNCTHTRIASYIALGNPNFTKLGFFVIS